MNSLFPIEPVFPEGFSYHPDFITREEEQRLHQAAKALSLHSFMFRGYEAKRRVASFGYDYNFDSRSISKGEQIPQGFQFLVEKVARFLSLQSSDFAELLVTEYPPGAVINWHRDAPPFDIIVGISLLTDCNFKLRPYDKLQQGRGSIISLTVAPRSLYVIKGPARSDWEHSIAPVKSIRYSVTLRTLNF